MRTHCFLFFFFREFYDVFPASDLKIADCSVGLLCAALYDNHWHRAKILEIFLDSNEIKLFYIDYATVSKVNVNQTKYLHDAFAWPPAMIYRGCLSKLFPVSKRFSFESADCFHSKIYDKLLVGQASYIDFEEQIVYMILTDISTEPHFCLNMYLLERGFGKLTEFDDLLNGPVKVSFYVNQRKGFGGWG